MRDLRAYTDKSDDQSKGTNLLEIYALEIQMYGETSNFKKLKVSAVAVEYQVPLCRYVYYPTLQETYDATLSVNNAIPHPRIMGIIRECGGKMHMSESA